MRVAFLYNRSSEDPAGFAEDDIPSQSPVVAAIRTLGHEVTPIACTLDLRRVRSEIEQIQPDVVFNRVESLGGSDAMAASIPLLLDSMNIPYTGCPAEAIVAANSKLSVKERLVQAGLPTPAWIIENGMHHNPKCERSLPAAAGNPKSILKSVFEHASFELNDNSIIGPMPADEIADIIRERSAETGRPFFAEEFIAGREFNISIIDGPPTVLPPAEIDFAAFPRDKPRIVGHQAKWDAVSFEFHNTPRRFNYSAEDRTLVRRLSELSLECWRLFGLRGYARVDFRCDECSRPWILEINTNPCIMPNAGFAAAVEQAGMTYEQAIGRIIDTAVSDSEMRTLGNYARSFVG